MLSVRPWHFTAQARGGEDLARIADARWIERATQKLHGIEVGLREHLGHVCLLVHAHSMLAGDGAPGLDAVLQNLSRHGFGVRGLTGNGFVVADQRMQVAVAGVEHVANPQARAGLESSDATEDLRKLGSRHHAVLYVIAWRHAPHGCEGGLTPLPDAIARGG